MDKDLYYRVSVKAGAVGYDLSSDLTSLTIEEEGGKPDQLTIQMSDPYKVFSHALQKGMLVVVDIGTAADHSVIFRGEIYKVDGNFPANAVPTLTLTAYDRSMKMGLRKRNRIWTGVSLEGIVKKIARDYFFPEDIIVNLKGNPLFQRNGIRQQDETDLAFLLRLAGTYGCEMSVKADAQGDGLYFISQYHIMQAEPEATLYYGRCGVKQRLLSFQPSSDVSHIQLPRVFCGIAYDTGQRLEITPAPIEEVGTREDRFVDENLLEFMKDNPQKGQQLQGLLAAAPMVQDQLRGDLGEVEREATLTFTTAAALQARVDNQFSTSIHGMRASGTAAGNHRLEAQSGVSIQGVGGGFSGTWFLSRVRHILNGQGYQTEFECQR